MNLVTNPRPSKENLRTLFLSHKLIEASRNGDLGAVQQLVERHFTPVNYQNCRDGTTALFAAVVGGFIHVVKYLVDHGADVNLANIGGQTPLHLAVVGDSADILSFLLSEGSWLEPEDEFGDTPLMYAIREDKPQAVELLLMHGADADHPNEDDETPAMLSEEVASEVVRELLATCVGRDVSNAMVPEYGMARSSLGIGYEMKVYFPLSKGMARRTDSTMTDDSDSSGTEEALNQSGGVRPSNSHSPPLFFGAMANSKHFSGVPKVLTADMDRFRHDISYT